MARTRRFVIGVDVGTGSARAAAFDLRGRRRGMGVRPITIWRPASDFVEQSSDDIWRACSAAVRSAMREAGASPVHVAGISFDATCSLVCVDSDGKPLTVSPSGRSQQNVIVWMDHRAIDQVGRINATKHRVLRYVGGVMSPEMEPPKLLWLKENLPRTWQQACLFLDLADYLTWRATGVDVRSLCTTVCKWAYQGHARGRAGRIGAWDDSFWQKIGLGGLVDEEYARIGRNIRPMGEPIGHGLTPAAAKSLGLAPGTPVGVGIIDAHAGGLGLIGAAFDGEALTPKTADRRLALIGGTSSCHMAVSARPRFIHGVWGPYYSAMVPGMWLTEGGQSTTGALIDHCIESNHHAAALRREAKATSLSVYELLNRRLARLAGKNEVGELTRRLHVLGDHHGNRSPRADPHARGIISGLRLNDTPDELALHYLATIQSVAYGTRHIIDALNARGYSIDTLLACGGGTKNPVFLQQHADITGAQIVLGDEPEAVLLGSAILAAVAAGAYGDCIAAMTAMTRPGRTVRPNPATVDFHDRKYRVYRRMYDDQVRYDRTMAVAPV